jgi:hypothetical protein
VKRSVDQKLKNNNRMSLIEVNALQFVSLIIIKIITKGFDIFVHLRVHLHLLIGIL